MLPPQAGRRRGQERAVSHAHSQALLPAQSSLLSAVTSGARAPSAMQKRGSRSPCQLHSTGADSQYLHPLTQGSQQPIVPQGPPAEKLPITWRWGQWLGEADACAQHNGSARQHQNQHKIKNQTICSDLHSCLDLRPMTGTAQPWPAES